MNSREVEIFCLGGTRLCWLIAAFMLSLYLMFLTVCVNMYALLWTFLETRSVWLALGASAIVLVPELWLISKWQKLIKWMDSIFAEMIEEAESDAACYLSSIHQSRDRSSLLPIDSGNERADPPR